MENGSGDAVKILLSDASHATAPVLALLNNLHVLELDEGRADDAGVGLAEVLSADSVAVVSTVPLTQLTNTKTRAKVYLAGDRGGTDVVPVIAVGGELVGARSLHKVGPDGELELV